MEKLRKNPAAVLWASAHRNLMSEIARSCGCTPQFVHYILYGERRSRDGKVERMLREEGAPVIWRP
jgi:hypothetical protein